MEGQVSMAEVLKNNLYNEVEGVDDPFLTYLLNTKLSENLNIMRTSIVDKQLNSADSQSTKSNMAQYHDDYPSLAFECSQKQYQMLGIMEKKYNDYHTMAKARRYSVDFDAPNEGVIEPLESKYQNEKEMDESSEGIAELRKRLLGRKASDGIGGIDSEKSIERQIEDQDNLQGNILEDMTKLVGSLKQGATAFQNALDEDKFVLSAAEIGVQVASTSLTDISGKLRKYDKKKLGYLFYITVFLVMIVGLIITFIIITIFPAL